MRSFVQFRNFDPEPMFYGEGCCSLQMNPEGGARFRVPLDADTEHLWAQQFIDRDWTKGRQSTVLLRVRCRVTDQRATQVSAGDYLRALARRCCRDIFFHRGIAVKLRAVVADDNPEFLSQVLRTVSAELDVVGTASDGPSALDSIGTLRPDIAIIDLKMPGLNGIELTRKVTCCPPKAAVVICSLESDPDVIQHALDAGAMGYVLKARIATDLIAAVKSVASGQQFVSPV